MTTDQTQSAKELAEQYTNETYAELHFINGYTAAIEQWCARWVSIDTLPEIGEFVLVYNTEGAILTGRLMNNGWVASFLDGEHLMNELAPTHWMPLPNKPDESPTPDAVEGGYSKEEIELAAKTHSTRAYAKAPRQSEEDSEYIQAVSFHSFIAGTKLHQSTHPAPEGKEKCIAFAEWANMNYCYVENNKWDGEEDYTYTTDEIYQLYLEHLTLTK